MQTTRQKLQKVAKTLSAHVARGNTANGLRSQELIDRYQELRTKAIHEGTWPEFCHERGWDISSDAYDFFA